MANIVIDPIIIITPPDNSPKEVIEAWFSNLSTWLNEALSAPFIWLHYQQASNLLQEHNRFPDFNKLRRLQQQYQLDININQLGRRINDFFRDDNLDLASQIDHLDFVIEPEIGSTLVQPLQFIARLPGYIHDDFYILLAKCCVCKHIPLPFGENLSIATLALPGNASVITVSFNIIEALPDSICKDGKTITQTFPLIITPDDLSSFTDIIDAWSQGEKSIIYTIQQQLKKDLAAANIKTFKFHLGPYFVQSVNERGLDTNGVVLRSIIRAASNIILDRAKNIKGYGLHDLRISEAPDSPQRERTSDNGRAWRLKLQQSGAGWRLHYWQIPTLDGPLIEFANICKENERKIY